MSQQSGWKAWYPPYMHPMCDFALSQAGIVYAGSSKRNARPPPFKVPAVGFHIRAIPGKGLGMLASKPLARGELFLVESPLFVHCESIPPAGLLAFFHALPQAAKSALMNLTSSNVANAHLAETDPENMTRRLVETLDTNCFDISTHHEEETLGVFPVGSRINHSCLPNATRHFFVSHSPRLEFRAVRDIDIGEEITISYIQPFQQWKQRQTFLRRHWQFRCTCEACSLRGLALSNSDRRRVALRDILDADLTPSDAVSTLEKGLELLDEERYFSGRFQFFARTLKVLDSAADEAVINHWISIAKETYLVERGTTIQTSGKPQFCLRVVVVKEMIDVKNNFDFKTINPSMWMSHQA